MNLKRSQTLRCRAAATLLAAAGLGSGCNAFYNTSTSATVFQTTETLKFNKRLPNAMEDLFAQCHDPLVVERAQVPPLGSCEGQLLSDYGDYETQVLALALGSQPDLDFRSAFPLAMVNSLQQIHGFEDFPWPLQGCEVFLDLDMDLLGVGLVDLDAAWVTHNGLASLHIDFDRDTSFPFITGDIEGDVDCPNPFNEIFIQPALPNGSYDVTVSGVDVDLWFMFDVVNGEVVTTIESDVDIGNVSISPPLSSTVTDNVGGIEDILEEATGKDLDELEADLDDNLADQLAGVAAALDDELNGEVHPDATVESVDIVNDKLHIVTTRRTQLVPS